MRTIWKVLLVAALVLPLGAFVLQSVATSADKPAHRGTLVVDDSPAPGGPRTGDTRSAAPDGPDEDDGEVAVVPPEPATAGEARKSGDDRDDRRSGADDDRVGDDDDLGRGDDDDDDGDDDDGDDDGDDDDGDDDGDDDDGDDDDGDDDGDD